ncbi:hypothetical protein [Roseobacter weihaiensis]|uniref:hypothetical protein n=1 Tax=Roseobacter weihaiensis TaxID=2763262 RepID=UPI001D0B84E1|nr:hypothetical protein [Roseobacter sp. H9]
MSLFDNIREFLARRALERKTYAELSAITDDELLDLNLSHAKLAELSRRQAATI